MKTTGYILLCLLIHSSVYCQQYYLRGEVKDDSGNPLQNATILNLRTGYIYKSGSSGAFGIITNRQIDTFNFSLDGYQPERIVVNAEHYATVQLKSLPVAISAIRQNRLSSLTKGIGKEEQKTWFTGDETYASILENRFVNTSHYPDTRISLNIDRASYSNIRRFISLSSFVPPDAVRIEEMLNYFNLNYTEPPADKPFHITTTLTSCPWNTSNQLYYINLSAKKLNLDELSPSNLVFLVDVSGSMDMTNRLPLLKSSFRLLANNLREKDTVSIVVYGGVTGIMLNGISGIEKDTILKTIDKLVAGGSTPGESGIRIAYTLAKQHFIKGGNNRVILATDGDFNVGVKTEDELNDLISQQRESGIYLTCLGVGMGNYKDSKIQTLAQKGNGNFAYIDNFNEGEKVLMKEFTQTLYSVADDVYMNIDFNPAYVKEYRLIGFDNKVGALNDTLAIVEGGEVGSGYSMVGIFEIIPEVNQRVSKDNNIPRDNFANISLAYRQPNDTTGHVFTYVSKLEFHDFDKIEKHCRFSAAIVMFGSLLRNSPYAKNISWNELQSLAVSSADPDDLLQQEFVSLVTQAKELYTDKKRRKKRGRNDED